MSIPSLQELLSPSEFEALLKVAAKKDEKEAPIHWTKPRLREAAKMLALSTLATGTGYGVGRTIGRSFGPGGISSAIPAAGALLGAAVPVLGMYTKKKMLDRVRHAGNDANK